MYSAVMPRQRASTLATGGGGYTFADKVAAAFLTQMLKRIAPFDTDLGPLFELHFETRESDQLLDDLRLILDAAAQNAGAVSVKIAAQLGSHGFSKEFVADAWEHTQQASFDYTSDLLVLVLGAINDGALQEWRKIETQASHTTPERLVERLGTQQSSATQKRIFESLRGVNGAKKDPIDTARLASRIRVVHFSDERVHICSQSLRRTCTGRYGCGRHKALGPSAETGVGQPSAWRVLRHCEIAPCATARVRASGLSGS